MGVVGIKFAFLLDGRETTSKEFEEAHFRQLPPAKAGRCIENMKYQVWDAYCQYGDKIDRDGKIKKVSLDKEHTQEFQFLNYTDAYNLELDQYRYVVYFILIPSNSSSIFAFYDVE